MAFRELTTDELELLTQEQRKVYEEQLDIYRQRVRFVEQLEKTENLQMEPFEPTLKRIPAVKSAPEKEFKNPKHQVQKVTVMKKRAPDVLGVRVAPITSPDVPQFVAPVQPRLETDRKIEIGAPVVPAGEKIQIPVSKSISAQPVKAEVLAVAGPKIPAVNSVKPEIAPAGVPAVAGPKIPAVNTAKPEIDRASVPAVTKLQAVQAKVVPNKLINPETLNTSVAVKAPKAPAVRVAAVDEIKPALPVAAAKVTQVKVRRIEATRMSALPDMPVPKSNKVSFEKPQIGVAALPSVQKAAIPKAEKIDAAAVIPGTPMAVTPIHIRNPEIRKVEKPSVVALDASAQPAVEAMTAFVRDKQFVSGKAIQEAAQGGVDVHTAAAPCTVPDPYANKFVKAILQAMSDEGRKGANA